MATSCKIKTSHNCGTTLPSSCIVPTLTIPDCIDQEMCFDSLDDVLEEVKDHHTL